VKIFARDEMTILTQRFDSSARTATSVVAVQNVVLQVTVLVNLRYFS